MLNVNTVMLTPRITQNFWLVKVQNKCSIFYKYTRQCKVFFIIIAFKLIIEGQKDRKREVERQSNREREIVENRKRKRCVDKEKYVQGRDIEKLRD